MATVPDSWLRSLRDVVLALGVLGAAAYVVHTLLGVRNPTTVALSLLLVVLGAATLSRLAVAVLTSIAATLILNYFYLPPVGTFTIADPQNWIALVAFVITAVVASQLSAAAQKRTNEAVESRREVARLFDLSRDILMTTDSEDALPALARHVSRRFDLDAVAICLPHSGRWTIHQGGDRDMRPTEADLDATFARLKGGLEYDARQRTYGGIARLDRDGRTMTLVPVRLGTRAVGLLAADNPSLSAGTLDAVGGVVAIAIERAALLSEKKAAETLQQRADLASALLASVGHDLRTPLTAIRVAVTNLQEHNLSEDERQNQAQLAGQEVQRLNRLFQDILDMARIDVAGIAAERQSVTPADIVDAALANVGALVANRRLDIHADATTAIRVDPRLTSSALAHLLENAALYSPSSTTIEISGDVNEEGLRLAVRDHGPGLNPAELDRLFDRFYRGTSARRSTYGSGMGLAITRGLLAAEGGRVWGENAGGGGACFTIVIPGVGHPVETQEV